MTSGLYAVGPSDAATFILWPAQLWRSGSLPPVSEHRVRRRSAHSQHSERDATKNFRSRNLSQRTKSGRDSQGTPLRQYNKAKQVLDRNPAPAGEQLVLTT